MKASVKKFEDEIANMKTDCELNVKLGCESLHYLEFARGQENLRQTYQVAR